MKYTVCAESEWRSDKPALLFEGTDVEEIAKDPAVAALFPHGYFVRAFLHKTTSYRRYTPAEEMGRPTHTLVSTVLTASDPDAVKIDTPPILFFLNGVEHKVDLRARFNQCLSLFKAVGCSRCPDRGAVCLSEGAGVPIPESVGVEVGATAMCERLEENKTIIAGREFISPSKTKTSPFQKKIRSASRHDFEGVEQNAKERSERSSNAAETKKFKKTQCSKCVLKDNCNAAAYCKGPLPPENEIIASSAAKMRRLIKTCGMPEWQLWELVRNVGATAKHSRWEIMLTGVKLQGNKFVIQVHRAKTDIQPYNGLKTYDEVAEKFKLARKEEDVSPHRGPVKDNEVLAMWWLILQVKYPSQRYGWGLTRSVIGVGVARDRLNLEWSNGRYISSHGGELWKIADISRVGPHASLPGIEKIEVR